MLPGVKKIAVDRTTFGACLFAMRSMPMVISLCDSSQDRALTIYDIKVYQAPTDGSSGMGIENTERNRIWQLVKNSQLDGPGWAELEQAIFPERAKSELGQWLRESEV
jgi:hypothetical protein